MTVEARVMAGKFLHEEIYRGGDALAKLRVPQVTICGAGAIGSHLADNLARQGFARLRVIDRDRVEEHNVNTQLYGASDVGAWKVEVLRNRLFRAVDVELDAVAKELSERTVGSLLKGSNLVVDTFDNSASRELVQQFCRKEGFDCLHVGLYADYCEVVWDEVYRVPRDVAGDVCEYPLARNLVLLSVAIASETIVRFILGGERRSRSATLTDFAVHDLER
jgi:molybdopterin/thiamine biosynthesis adenylyltransferase